MAAEDGHDEDHVHDVQRACLAEHPFNVDTELLMDKFDLDSVLFLSV